jgi:hypothetical protein
MIEAWQQVRRIRTLGTIQSCGLDRTDNVKYIVGVIR